MRNQAANPTYQPLHLPPAWQVRVFHNNAGAAPEWFLENVRVRRQGGDGRWTVFPCGRWLAVNEDDGCVDNQGNGSGWGQDCCSLTC